MNAFRHFLHAAHPHIIFLQIIPDPRRDIIVGVFPLSVKKVTQRFYILPQCILYFHKKSGIPDLKFRLVLPLFHLLHQRRMIQFQPVIQIQIQPIGLSLAFLPAQCTQFLHTCGKYLLRRLRNASSQNALT